MEPKVRDYLAEIGRRGGSKSRRTLDPETARRMVRVREARRAYRRFHAACFWSYDPAYRVGPSDVAWVAEQLRRHGGRDAWDAASKLCR
jgi:CRISPR/Cas system-associated protein Csm6